MVGNVLAIAEQFQSEDSKLASRSQQMVIWPVR